MPLVATDFRSGGLPSLVLFAAGGTAARLAGPHDLSRAVRLEYLIVEMIAPGRRWRVQTVGYAYSIIGPSEKELVVHHWHPSGESRITFPHLHLGTASDPFDLRKTHVPTRHIPLRAVVWYAISELGAEPPRPDWEDILGAAGGFVGPEP